MSYLAQASGIMQGRSGVRAKALLRERDVPRINRNIIWAGLETLYFSGTHHLARPFLSGVGAILTFHHVRPARHDPVQLNDLLEITPEFFEEVIGRLRDDGFDIVSLDELHRRFTEGDFGRRFAAVTFDDGYRDNLEHAYPILKRENVPFTLFVPSAFADGEGELWWVVLDRVIAKASHIDIDIEGERWAFDCATPTEKCVVSEAIYWRLREIGDEAELRRAVRALGERHGVDTAAVCRELCLDWDELAALAADPLCTIGAHTHSHLILKKADLRTAERDIRLGVRRIEERLGRRPEHFSYPFGDQSAAGPREFDLARSLGFKTAVTTRPGVLFADHADYLTALPRISVNGRFQRLRYLDVLLSGAPTAIANGFRRVDAA